MEKTIIAILLGAIFAYGAECPLDQDLICKDNIMYTYAGKGRIVTVKEVHSIDSYSLVPCECPKKKEE